MLKWYATLEKWPTAARAPDALPFVSLYVGGQVRGCFGSGEGGAGERVARAFLRAAGDARFGGVPARGERMTASVSYAIAPRAPVSGDAVLDVLEPGTHGVVLVRPGAPAAVLLPQVARDGGLDGAAFLATLARKAGLAADGWRDGHVLMFEAETVTTHEDAGRGDGVALAAAWLAKQVGDDGAVRFALDARTGERHARGQMFHGRACTLVQALAARGGHARVVARARAFLEREIRRGLAGNAPDEWPEESSMIGGTLALAVLAGIDLRRELLALARSAPDVASSSWHAAQIAVALGAETPPNVWRAAVDDLAERPFAPWTLIAARARADGAVFARCERALVAALRADGPHPGGAAVTSVPEIALTAVAVEALAPLARKSPAARAAVARGRDFLARWQFLPGRVPAALDPALALGAFPASPVHYALRCDITAHALLAL